ncbi:hypothetical protein Trydic_g19448 [Trypoxylus dichotomus]
MLNKGVIRIVTRNFAKAGPISELEKDARIKKKILIDKFKQKSVRVAVLGACTPTGEALSLLLKTNPLVSHLYLHGDAARGISADLATIDTRTMVSGHFDNDMEKAVRRAEIIVILPENVYGEAVSPPEEKFRHEYERLIRIARTCTTYAPKSLLYVCVPPVAMAVPLLAAIFKKTHWYHPGRIIGSVAFHQVRLNSLVAFHNDLDPSGVHVPLIGGPDIDCLVPLLSRATPVGLSPVEALCLTKRYRNIEDHDEVTIEKKSIEFADLSPLSHAYALNRSIITIALGLLGDPSADMCGFIRSNVLRTCKHLATTLRMGPGGVYHNFGIPLLSPLELQLMERATLILDERERQAISMLESVDERKVAIKTN